MPLDIGFILYFQKFNKQTKTNYLTLDYITSQNGLTLVKNDTLKMFLKRL